MISSRHHYQMWQWSVSVVVVLQKPKPLMGPVRYMPRKVLHHQCQQKNHPWKGHCSKYLWLCPPGFAHHKKVVLAFFPPLCPQCCSGRMFVSRQPLFPLMEGRWWFPEGWPLAIHSQHCFLAAEPVLYWVPTFDKFWVFEQIKQKFLLSNRNL